MNTNSNFMSNWQNKTKMQHMATIEIISYTTIISAAAEMMHTYHSVIFRHELLKGL